MHWLFYLGFLGVGRFGAFEVTYTSFGDSSKIARAEFSLLIEKIDMHGYFPRFINRPRNRLLLFRCPSRFISTREQFSAIFKKQLHVL